MAYDFFSVNYSGAAAQPGLMTVNGSSYDGTFFSAAPAFHVPEGSAANDWLPYDRMIQMPAPSRGYGLGHGLYFWNRDFILTRTAALGWSQVHQTLNQDTTDDHSHHTGLYDFFGTDGRLYVCGIYPADTANTMGWFKFDPEAGTYTSGTNGIGHANPTRLGWATPYEGRLYCASDGVLYIFDPVAENVATLATPTTDHRDKLIVSGTKLYLVGIEGGNLELYEVFGGTVFIHQATLGTQGIGANGEWTMHRDQENVIVHWWSAGVQTRIFRPDDDAVGGNVTVTSHNIAGPFGGRAGEPGEPNASFNANDRYFAATDIDQAPGTTTTGNTIYRQEGGAGDFGAIWYPFRWAGSAAPWTSLGAAFGGEHSYFGASLGNGPNIYNGPGVSNQDKIVIYESSRDVDDRQHLKFWAFNPSTVSTLSARILTKDRSGTNNRTRFPLDAGTMHSVQSGGTYNAGQNRIDDVAQSPTGGGVHEVTWDRPADGIGVDTPDDGVYASLFMFAP